MADDEKDANMSMAETFVSMFTDELTLTQVTQLPPEELDSPNTPTTNTSIPITPTTYPVVQLQPEDINSREKIPTVLSSELKLPEAMGSPALKSIHTSSDYPEKYLKNPRRELFPGNKFEEYFSAKEEDVKPDFNDSSCHVLGASNSSILDSKAVCVSEVDSLSQQLPLVNVNSASSKDANKAKDTSCGSLTVPKRLLKLTNRELKEKLISLGEQPGPVNDATRSAYLTYLARIQGGILPTGNKGYKGILNVTIIILSVTTSLWFKIVIVLFFSLCNNMASLNYISTSSLGYKYELSLVLNGTIAIPDLSSLEQQIFQSFRKSNIPFTSSSSSSSTPSQGTPSSFSRQPFNMTPAPHVSVTPRCTPRSQTKDHFNYLLLDPLVLDQLSAGSSGNCLPIILGAAVACEYQHISNGIMFIQIWRVFGCL